MSKAAISHAASADDLTVRLRERAARVCVVGLGYVGLPLA
jgi:hypothetical protein